MSIRLRFVSMACSSLVAGVLAGCSDAPHPTPGALTPPASSTAPSADTPQPSAAGAAADVAAAGRSAVAPPVQPPAKAPVKMPATNPPAPNSDPKPNMPPAAAPDKAAADTQPTLFFLNNLGQVVRAADDGSARRIIVTNAGSGPDGVAVDTAGGHVFWTNMGAASADDGTIMRADLDGKNLTTIVKSGGTYTPKQLKIDVDHGKLYWSDREGMRVMRASLDGSNIETLIQTGKTDADRSDASHWCVGIAVDAAGGKLYWTQKGGDNAHVGTIKRAGLDLPAGQAAASRTDIEVLFAKLPEPIDLDLDLERHQIYWTDRGDNTVSRAPLDVPTGAKPDARTDREILVRGLSEAIGLWLDPGRDRMFYTSLGGEVATAKLDGSMPHALLTGQGALTGIMLAELPK